MTDTKMRIFESAGASNPPYESIYEAEGASNPPYETIYEAEGGFI